MRYQFIKQHQGQHPVSLLCRVLQVGRGGYYAWLKRPLSAREVANRDLAEKIQTTFEETKETYGSPRLTFRRKCTKDHLDDIGCAHERLIRANLLIPQK